jgi:hypothetical protein
MGFFQANIWRYGFFKSIGSLFSSPRRAIKGVVISEAGIAALDSLSLAVGYSIKDSPEYKGAWIVIQKLMMNMKGSDEMVLPISERTYVPLDPLHRLNKEDKERLLPLNEIAQARYDAAFARVTEENKRSANARLLTTLVYLSFIMAAIFGVIVMLRGCGAH